MLAGQEEPVLVFLNDVTAEMKHHPCSSTDPTPRDINILPPHNELGGLERERENPWSWMSREEVGDEGGIGGQDEYNQVYCLKL